MAWPEAELIRKKAQEVMGHQLASPALTKTGLRLILQYVAAPILALLALIDLGLFLVFKYAFGQCYGVWCWF